MPEICQNNSGATSFFQLECTRWCFNAVIKRFSIYYTTVRDSDSQKVIYVRLCSQILYYWLPFDTTWFSFGRNTNFISFHFSSASVVKLNISFYLISISTYMSLHIE